MIQEIDFAVLDWIQNNLRCGFLDFLMPKITMIGEKGILYVVLCLIMVCFKRCRKAGITILGGMTAGLLIVNMLIKNAVARMRPFQINAAIELLVKAPNEYSFPSGHAVHGFIFATVLMCYDKRLGIPALIVAVLVSFSRLYLYVHFPTDVLAGAAIGVIIGLCSVFVANRIVKWYQNRKAA